MVSVTFTWVAGDGLEFVAASSSWRLWWLAIKL